MSILTMVRNADNVYLGTLGVVTADPPAGCRYQALDDSQAHALANGPVTVDLAGVIAPIVLQQSTPPDYSALRAKLASVAQSAVGVTLDNLTQAQRLALLACLLHSAGAFDPQTMAVRPLAQWVYNPNE